LVNELEDQVRLKVEKNKIESEKIILRGWVGKNSFFNRYDGSY
jgi:hypothetical protein